MSLPEPPLAPTLVAESLAHTDIHGERGRPPISSLRTIRPAPSDIKLGGFRASLGLENVARRTLGIFLLLITVILFTASNFLASFMFADNTYSKPYLITYLNTGVFAISLLPLLARSLYKNGYMAMRASATSLFRDTIGGDSRFQYRFLGDRDTYGATFDASSITEDEPEENIRNTFSDIDESLNISETVRLGLQFSMIWFLANYLVSVGLEYTSVASSTIITSTSSIWTLIFGALMRVERFSYRKLLGVLASLTGIILISSVDLSREDNDDSRGNFPHKTQAEIALGDIMAFGSAIMYGIYTVLIKKKIGNEDRINMPLFFGLVGLFNVVFLWPGFIILHFTGLERFELPPSGNVWTIILINALFSFVSDYTWAYSMLLTTPLVVTVGLSMAIPISLIGQMIFRAQYSSALYWVGAIVVLVSFLFINNESHDDEELGTELSHDR